MPLPGGELGGMTAPGTGDDGGWGGLVSLRTSSVGAGVGTVAGDGDVVGDAVGAALGVGEGVGVGLGVGFAVGVGFGVGVGVGFGLIVNVADFGNPRHPSLLQPMALTVCLPGSFGFGTVPAGNFAINCARSCSA